MAVPIRLGTRGSALALAQAGLVARALEGLGATVETVAIRTSGDEGPAAAPPRADSGDISAAIGPRSVEPGSRPVEDKARFVKELEQALLAGEIDLAVHSAKDVPSELPDGLAIVGVPERADARDALCLAARLAAGSPTGALVAGDAARTPPPHSLAARPLDPLPEGAVVGTASLRRRSQLLSLRPDLEIVELRGNVDTRLRRLAEGGAAAGDTGPESAAGSARPLDAIVLAAAGLARLGRAREGTPLPETTLVPSAGQGCLALEAREDDAAVRQLAERLTDPAAQTRIAAERTVIAALEATCNTPVGAHATIASGELLLRAYVGSADGTHWVREELHGDAAEPHTLGLQVANRLLTAGAAEILAAAEAAGEAAGSETDTPNH